VAEELNIPVGYVSYTWRVVGGIYTNEIYCPGSKRETCMYNI